MSTTTIRLPEELRVRIETVAAASGSSAHAFMVQAIAEATERMEQRQDFEAEAERRWKHMLQTGEYLTLEDLRAYAQALGRGERPDAPTPRKMSAEELERLRASARRLGDA
jgi:predicted transcriptional regulator